MNRLTAFALLSSVALFAPQAHAADVATPVSDWTGFYAAFGVGGGFAFSDTQGAGVGEYTDYGVDETSKTPSSSHFNGLFQCEEDDCAGSTGAAAALESDEGMAGFLGRAEIGADYQMDRIVAGVNASFTLGNRKMSSSGAGYGSAQTAAGEDWDNMQLDASGGGYGAVESELELGNSWSIGARLGFLLTDSTLLFASGGYTQAKAKLNASFDGAGGAGSDESDAIINGSYNISASNEDWLGGYYVGGGVETMLTEKFSLKVEYRYADLGSIKTSAGDGEPGKCVDVVEQCQGYFTGVEAEADVTDHTVMATIGFRF